MRSKLTVAGIVQGVGFRPFVYRIAVRNHLNGYITNMGDGTVEIEVEGRRQDIDRFVNELYSEKPPFARIEKFSRRDFDRELGYSKFLVLKSEHREKESASLIPPDLGICSDCVTELFDPKNRRFGYHFITCTNCGPRFTIIERFPYDRSNTTMKDFPLCRSCEVEYDDPLDRRFHAETIACGICGPTLQLFSNKGSLIGGDPIVNAASYIDQGKVLAVKGVGGFHITLSAYDSEAISRLRRWKHREQKPFAVMAKDLETVRQFAYVDAEEEEMLCSPSKPIVLLRLKEEAALSRLVSPGLHNIGVMLPYTGLHLLLFSKAKADVFVMTSGNLPSEPIVSDDKEAFRKFSDIVDYFLLHNRRILHKCDDSVIRKVDGAPYFLRKSRGYTPQPLDVPDAKDVIGLGAEQNVSGCVIASERAFLTQYIGDVENLETQEHLKSALRRMMTLTSAKPEAVAHDLHPSFNTTIFAEELSRELKIPAYPIQHHHAHIASVMAEEHLEQSVGIAIDGFGYGLDRNAWGGEVILCDGGHMKRIGHLEEQPYLGGDLAAKYPARIVLAVLSKKGLGFRWALENLTKFPYGGEEVKVLIRKLKLRDYIFTTSFGRILDALSTLLDICHTRTYEGEPAMKLESFAAKAHGDFKIDPIIKGDVLMTTPLLEKIYLNVGKVPNVELAYAGEEYLARGIAELAIEKANESGLKDISISGGVSYNEHISKTIRCMIEKEGLRLHRKRYAPPGDGCISLGQAYIVGKWVIR
ncbi:MAG: carbamoyltransferase HypF [Nitrososphaeria archaeon]